MAFDFTHFVDVAEELLTAPTTFPRACLRAAGGRAYYGTYGFLRSRLITEVGDCFNRRGKHRELINHCEQSSSPHIQRIGKRLATLYALRVRSDYDHEDASDPTQTEVETMIDLAKKACEKIANLHHADVKSIHGSF